MSEEMSLEQGSEEISSDQSDQSSSNSHEETQQSSTGEQADTSSSINTRGSEVGLQKKEVSEEVDSGANFSEGLNDLVNKALEGTLSDEQRQMLEDQGLGQHFEMIVNGHKAVVAKNDAEIVGVVGGKEAYAELQEWALSNLDDSEIESFNMAVIESGNIGLAKLAVEGLQARYLRINGQSPDKRIEAGGTANDATRPYSDRNEYINEAMSHKYKSDPAYRSQVEAKRNLSGF